MRLITLLFTSACLLGAAPKPLDPLTRAIITNDLSGIRQSKAEVNAKLAHGNTPLMYAAEYGSLEAVKILLDAGADVNAKSDSGATALMLAITDFAKVKLLVSKGAGVNAESKMGRTPLLLAASADGTAQVIDLLVTKGADVKAVDKRGNSLLLAAAASGNLHALKLGIEKKLPLELKAGDGSTALINAAGDGNTEAVRLLLAAGANVNAQGGPPFAKVKNGTIALGNFTPLLLAVTYGPPPLVKALLDAGAKVDAKDSRGFTPLHLAVTSEFQNPEIVRMLLAKGSQMDLKSDAAETAGDWAGKFRNPEVMSLLKVSTMPYRPLAPGAAPELRASVQKSLTLLEKTSSSFAKEGGCVSCHNQNVTSMAAKVANSHGLAVDAAAAAERTALAAAFMNPATEELVLHFDAPGGTDSTNYSLFGLAGDGYEPDLMTSAILRNIAMNQRHDGSWHGGYFARVPMEDSDISRTAMAIRNMQIFGMQGTHAEYSERMGRARAWLLSSKPIYTEEFNMRLLGLKWGGADSSAVRKAAADLAAQQRPGGGWAQNQYLGEDAYATGQALYALQESGVMSTTDPAYKKGVAYLLSTQAGDGSWHVRSRSPKFQPYFQSGFPYDHDQWISASATGWATMALAAAMERAQ